MSKRLTDRALSLLLAGWLLFSLAAPLAWAAPQAEGDPPAELVTISSVKDLLAFSKSCALDTWSQGKTVSLAADLDLTGVDFTPIPTFGGDFQGNGHTISGLRVTSAGSALGLFRYIQPGAVVQDLNVKGTVAPEGARSTVGGIVGDNAGTLRGCTFQGAVLGESAVGGIAGRNAASGEITGCTAYGAVSGESATGGIAGRNLGLLLKCENNAGINLTHTESDLDLMAQDAGAALEELASADDETYHLLSGCSDTGGIVGWTGGVVQSCVNNGSVGYPHVGYNTGGVAGRQSGYLAGCVNNGTVRGRKDVGGIVGQAEPCVLVDPGQDTLELLERELDTLDRLINKALDDVQATGDTVSVHLTAMGDYTGDARDSSKRLLDRVMDFTDETVDTVNLLVADVTNALDRVVPALDDLSDVGKRLEDLSDQLGQALETLGDAVEIGEAAMEDLRAGVQAMRHSGPRLEAALDEVERAIDELTRSLLADDETAISRALTHLNSAVEDMGGAFDDLSWGFDRMYDALSPHFDGLISIPGEISKSLSALRSATRSISSAMSALSTAMDGVSSSLDEVKSALADIKKDWQDARTTLKRAFNALRDAGDDLDEALADLERALGWSDELSEVLGNALEELREVSSSASAAGGLLSHAFDTISGAVDQLTADGPREFTPLGEAAREAGDSLYNALAGLSDEMAALNGTLQSGGDVVTADLRAISRQFNVVFDVLIHALADLRDDVEGGVESYVQDTSDEDIAATREGKVADCANAGAVEGDRNVGGVVGAMAIEVDLDPEDDIMEKLSFGATYETKAVLQGSVNRGSVTAKKDCVGGLIGRMDLGTALDCQSYGPIASTGGDYVGGAAGWASASIRGCYAKNTLSGGRYVGGVAGWASRLRDSYAIATIEEGTECLGAVAGNIETGGVLTGNRFVDTGWAGVDGVSYAGRAEPIAFEELAQLPGVPPEFTAFTLTLMADETFVAQLPFFYGSDLSRLDLPEVPEKEDCYGVWPEFDPSGTGSDLTLEAVYIPWVTLVASQEQEGKLSRALAEGKFTEEAVLRAEDSAQTPPEGGIYVWDISLTGSQLTGGETVPLRLLNPEGGDALVWQYQNGQWNQVEAVRNGKYLALAMEGTSGTFCLQPQEAFPWLIAVGAAAGAVVLLLVLALLGRRRRKKKAAKAAKAAEEAETDETREETEAAVK